MQETLFKANEQSAAHIELMTGFLDKVNFGKDDELYYVRGTETHVNDIEDPIGKELNAIPAANGLHVHELLELNINGLNHLFLHHGKSRGKGVNEGNVLRNYLRDTRVDRKRDGLSELDVMISGHRTVICIAVISKG